MAETNGRYPSWRWLVGILCALLFAVSGVFLADNRANVAESKSLAIQAEKRAEQLHAESVYKIDCLQKDKVDKEQYYKDISEIKDSVKSINHKLDRMRS